MAVSKLSETDGGPSLDKMDTQPTYAKAYQFPCVVTKSTIVIGGLPDTRSSEDPENNPTVISTQYPPGYCASLGDSFGPD